MSNPFTNTNYGVQEDTFEGGQGLFRVQMGLGGQAGSNKFPADFYIEDPGHSLEEQGFGGMWTKGTREVGDEGKVIDVWEAPFLPPHVLITPRRAKIYYVEAEKKSYMFPWSLPKEQCLHPTIPGFSLPLAPTGVNTSFALQVLLIFTDFPHLEPFYITLPGKGAKKMFFDNNLNDSKYGNQDMPWGISPTLNHAVVTARSVCEEKAKTDKDYAGTVDANGKCKVGFAPFSQWIGVGMPVEESSGKPKIIQFGKSKKSPINPVEYVVLPEGYKPEDIFQYCLLSAANKELNDRVGELQEFAAEWKDQWNAETLLAQNIAAQSAHNANPAEEEEDDIPF